MTKRIFSLFMVLALCLTLLPAPVWAVEESGVAVAEVTIDGTTTQYTDIDTAFTNALASEDSALKLLLDVTTDNEVTVSSGSHTLDLNGKTLTSTTSGEGFLYISGGTLTIQDSASGGAITSVKSTLRVNNGGTLTVTGGSFTSQNTNGLIVFDGGSAQLSGGTFSTTNPNEAHSIWVMNRGKAANLLVSGYRYMNANDTTQKSLYQTDGNGVVGATTVCKIPEGEVTFIGADGSETTQTGCTEIKTSTNDISQGWYVLKGDVTIALLNISNEVNLILCDGATLTVSTYLNVGENSTLNLYWQSAGSGKLTAASIGVMGSVTAPAGGMKRTTGESGTTFEKCLTHQWSCADNGDGTHKTTCKLCGMDGGTANHSFDRYTSKDANGHTYACACGATKTEAHTLSYVITSTTHRQECAICGYETAETAHVFDEATGKCVCGADKDIAVEKVAVTMTASDGATWTGKYTDLLEAFNAARLGRWTEGNTTVDAVAVSVKLLNENATYTLKSDKKFPIEFEYSHSVIVDLNGCTLKRTVTDDTYGILKVEEGNVTLKNGTLDFTVSTYNNPAAITLPGGYTPTLTLEDMTINVTGTKKDYGDGNYTGYAIYAGAGTLNIKGGTYGEVQIHSATVKLSGGNYTEVEHLFDKYAELLETGYIFAKQDGTYINPTNMKSTGADEYIKNIQVIKCNHQGATFTDDKCSQCGFECQHTNVDENGQCTTCGAQMAAKDNNGHYYNSADEAFEGAADGSTVTLLTDAQLDNSLFIKPTSTSWVRTDKSVTLVMNGKKLSMAGNPALIVASGKLTIEDAAVITADPNHDGILTQPALSVLGGTLELRGKVTVTGGLKVWRYEDADYITRTGTLEGGLKEGSILQKGSNSYSVSVEGADPEKYTQVRDLLPEGYAFAKYDTSKENHTGDIVDGSVEKLTEDVIVVKCGHQNGEASLFENGTCKGCGFTCEHAKVENTKCSTCGAQMVAQVGDSYYSTLAAAIEAAKNGGTVELVSWNTTSCDVTESITIEAGTNVTIDMKNTLWEAGDTASPALTVDGGDVTLKNGALYFVKDSSASSIVMVKSGSLTLGESMQFGDNTSRVPAIIVEGGTLTLSEGTRLYGGMKTSVEGATLASYLPEGTAFKRWDNTGKVITNGYVTDLTDPGTQFSLIVEKHTHSAGADGECACGFTCSTHEFENGICKNCGYVCPHDHVTDNTCDTCNAQMAVKVTNGEKDTYYAQTTDSYDTENTLQTLLNNDAITPSGSTVTLLMNDLNAFAFVDGGKNITLDLNGKNLMETVNGGFCVDPGSTLTVTGEGSSTRTGDPDKKEYSYVFNVRGGTLEFGDHFGGEFNGIRIGIGTLTSTGSDVHIGTLQIDDSSATISFQAGTFDKIEVEAGAPAGTSVTLGNLLASGNGYAFQHTTGDKAYVKYNTKITKDEPVESVKIAYCTHDSVTGGTCDYCDMTNIAATITAADGTVTVYDNTATALTAFGTGGGTLKLFADATFTENIDLKVVQGQSATSFTLDLNGHTTTTVSGDVALTAWENVTLTITDSSEGKTGWFAREVAVKSGGSLIVDGAAINWIQAKEQNTSVLLKAGSRFNMIRLSGSGHRLYNCIAPDSWISGADFNTMDTSKPTTVSRIPGTITPSQKTAATISYGGNVPDDLRPTLTLNDGVDARLEYKWYYKDSSGGCNNASYSYAPVTAGQPHEMVCVIEATTSDNITWQAVVTGYSLTVTKGQATVYAAPTAVENLTYNGEAQKLVAAGRADGGTMVYSLSENGTYSETIPTGTQAGKYIVYYKVVGDANHNDSDVQSIEVTIAPKTVDNPTIEIASGSVYNGKGQTPGICVKDEGGTVIPASEYMATYSNNVNAGEGTVTITDKEGGNYTVNGSAEFSIAKAAAPTLDNVTHSQKYTVTEGTVSLANAGMPAGAGTLTYAKGAESVNGVSSWDVDNTGKVSYTLSGGQVNDTVTLPVTISSTNYENATVNVVITLTDRDTPTVTANAITVTYDGSAVPAEKITGTAKFGGTDVAGAWSWKAGQALTNVADSGEKTVIFTPTDDINYKPVETKVQLTISPAALTAVSVAQSGTLTYNGAAQTAEVDAQATAVNGQTVTFTYCDTQNGTYGAMPQFKDAGEHTVYYKVSAPNHADANGSFTVSIAKADPTCVAPTGVTATYGDTLSKITLANPTGNTEGSWSWADDTQRVGDVGSRSFKATFKPTDAKNYNEKSEIDVTVNVGAAESNVSAAPTAKTLTYNGSAQALVNGGTTADGKLVYSLSETGEYGEVIPTGKDAGKYTVWYKVVGDDNHKDSTPASVEVTIDKAKVTITVKDKSAYVGSTAPDLSKPVPEQDYTISGLIGADKLTTVPKLAYDPAEPDMTQTGEVAKIVASGAAEEGNYTITYVFGKLTLSRRSSSGGSSTPSTPGKTEITTNPDGSIKITPPKNSGKTKVEIPVKDVTPGTVAIIVKPDGSEEIVKDALPTKNGLELTVDGSVTVKIVDNAKDFADTKGHWAEDAIDFVSARGLVNGMTETTFAPNAPTTRAQLWTILARQADADLTGGSTWYEKAQAWAKASGISDGSDPNGNITRAQMVTMLWRAAGSPAVSGSSAFTDVPGDSYYAQAVAWAAENGITTGVAEGKFDPNGTCTRAQIATFLYRTYQVR